MSKVTITRIKAALMVPAHIIIDGEKKGNLKNGASMDIELTPGKHEMQVQSTFGVKSEVQEINVASDGVTTIEISKSPNYMKYYYTKVYPVMIGGSILGLILMAVQGGLGAVVIGASVCTGYVFVIKANKLIFDITQK